MKQQLQQRFESYWRLEFLNVLLIPATTLLVCAMIGQPIGLFSVSSLLVTCVLLLIGTGYWRAKLRQLDGDLQALHTTLFWASRLQISLFLSVIALLLACAMDLFFAEISISRADRIIAICITLLSLLEYINYYHIQIQYFDHLPDFHRLISGRGFRRSKMSLDLCRYRRRLECG